MAQPQPNKLTEAEYLAIERKAETKSEFFEGRMYPVHGTEHPQRSVPPGEQRRHDLICANLVRHFREVTREPALVLPRSSEFRVGNASHTFDPDVAVVRDGQVLTGTDGQTIANPDLVFEVTTQATFARDIVKRCDVYRSIDGLTELVFVEASVASVVHYWKAKDDGWILEDLRGRAANLRLRSIDAVLGLHEIYAGIEPELTS